MQLPILVEPAPGGGFRAQVGDPFHVSAEAEDAWRAVEEVVRLVEAKLRGGATVAALTLTNGAVHATMPSIPADDAYTTDWVYRELQDAIAENRRHEESVGP